MVKIEKDECLDFLGECRSELIVSVQALADEHKYLSELLCRFEKDIERSRERDDEQLNMNVVRSVALLNISADSTLEAANSIKKIAELTEKAINHTKEFHHE